MEKIREPFIIKYIVCDAWNFGYVKSYNLDLILNNIAQYSTRLIQSRILTVLRMYYKI